MGCNCKNKNNNGSGEEQQSSILERVFLFAIVLVTFPIIGVLALVIVFVKYTFSLIVGRDFKINLDRLYKLKHHYSQKRNG